MIGQNCKEKEGKTYTELCKLQHCVQSDEEEKDVMRVGKDG